MNASLPFVKAFSSALVSAGFLRYKGRIWIRDKGQIVELVDLQKSNYSELLYVNLGVILKEIWSTENNFLTYRSHLVDRLNLKGLDELAGLLEHPQNFIEGDVEVFRRDLLPRVEEFFNRFDTVEKLRQYALTPQNLVPNPNRKFREWAGFDFSIWDSPKRIN